MSNHFFASPLGFKERNTYVNLRNSPGESSSNEGFFFLFGFDAVKNE